MSREKVDRAREAPANPVQKWVCCKMLAAHPYSAFIRQIYMMYFTQISFKYAEERFKCIYIIIAAGVQNMIPPTRISILVFEDLFVIPCHKQFEILQWTLLAVIGKRIVHTKQLIPERQ